MLTSPLSLALGTLFAALAGSSAGAAPCPSLADIETAVGLPVRAHPMVPDQCMYEFTGRYQGAFVTLSYQPASRADDLFAGIRQRVKVKGIDAQPDRLTIGEGGWGYRSRGKQEAAAVSHGRVYHADVEYDILEESMKLREDGAIRVIEVAMRAAPAEKRGAAFDACMLATNAEVSAIAEEQPEVAKHWSPPEASLGGSNCQYDGGSIRIYQGNAPAASFESALKSFRADAQPKTGVRGLGDRAFFMIPMPDDKYNRFGLLAVYAGPRIVQLTLDAQGDEPVESTRPRLERLARLVLPRLR